MRLLRQSTFSMTLGAAVWAAAPNAFAQQQTPAGAPVQPTQDEGIKLSVEQMRLAAELNLRNRQYGRALAFADALLARDASDVTALLIRTHALREMAQHSAAQQAGRAAWRAAQTDDLKYTAAILTAQALSAEGKRTRAQLWLRRAAQVAPTKGHAIRAAQDFKHVQQRNPWQTHLSFTLAPNSNINNGSSRDTSALLYRLFNPLDIDGMGEVALGAESKALSGIEAGFGVRSRYRFHQTERSAHDLRLGMSYRTYQLSQSARDALDAADAERQDRGEKPKRLTGNDFSYGSVQFGYGYKRLRTDRRGEFSFNADLGQTFYGGMRYNSFLRASIGQTYQTSATTRLSFGLSGDMRNAHAAWIRTHCACPLG